MRWPWQKRAEARHPGESDMERYWIERAKEGVVKLTQVELDAIGAMARRPAYWPGLVTYQDATLRGRDCATPYIKGEDDAPHLPRDIDDLPPPGGWRGPVPVRRRNF